MREPRDDGDAGRLQATAPASPVVHCVLDPDRLVDWTGNVPPAVPLRVLARPNGDGRHPNFARLWENLWDDEYVEAHQAMARWAREHVAFPGAAFRQVADQWLRENGFIEDRLRLAGERSTCGG